MRRYWRERPPKSIFSGAELPRLMTGLLMLAVIWMLIVRAREPGTWSWFAKLDAPQQAKHAAVAPTDSPPSQPQPPANKAVATDGKPTEKPAEPPAERQADAAAKPKAERSKPDDVAPTGPTDEDPEQIEEARNEFQAITDGTLKLGPEEMEAYDRLVEWVKNQPFAVLKKRAEKGLWYTDLYDTPEKYRGKIVELEVEIRRAASVGKNRYGVPLWEAWAFTEESRGRLYDLLVLDYPEQMPLGYKIFAKAKFVGYFLKLQGYEPASLKPGDPADKAPLLVGRVEWIPPVAVKSPVDTTQEWLWGLALLVIIGVVFLLRAGYYKLTAKRRVAAAVGGRWRAAPDEESIPIEAWLERAEFDDRDNTSPYSLEVEPDSHSYGRADDEESLRAKRGDLTEGSDDRLS